MNAAQLQLSVKDGLIIPSRRITDWLIQAKVGQVRQAHNARRWGNFSQHPVRSIVTSNCTQSTHTGDNTVWRSQQQYWTLGQLITTVVGYTGHLCVFSPKTLSYQSAMTYYRTRLAFPILSSSPAPTRCCTRRLSVKNRCHHALPGALADPSRLCMYGDLSASKAHRCNDVRIAVNMTSWLWLSLHRCHDRCPAFGSKACVKNGVWLASAFVPSLSVSPWYDL